MTPHEKRHDKTPWNFDFWVHEVYTTALNSIPERCLSRSESTRAMLCTNVSRATCFQGVASCACLHPAVVENERSYDTICFVLGFGTLDHESFDGQLTTAKLLKALRIIAFCRTVTPRGYHSYITTLSTLFADHARKPQTFLLLLYVSLSLTVLRMLSIY